MSQILREPPPPSAVPASIRILTLNCWGLKYISTHRHARLSEIGRRLACHSPELDIVGLQECWTYSDYASIRQQTRHLLPYGKFYYSGIFGAGLAILSRWPLEDSTMLRYPLNGRPTAFFRGDWYVGKGVACARIRMPDGMLLEVFNTHLHAPYEREPNDSYICHRTAQAWEIARLMRDAQRRGSLVVGLGDFNMVPLSFAHVLLEARGQVRDVWRVLRPGSSVGASEDEAEKKRRKTLGLGEIPPTAAESLTEHGHTCDSILNTWRWSKAHQNDLARGSDRDVGPHEEDVRAKRLDYIFFGGGGEGWQVQEAQVSMTERHPELRCSLSDHFAVEALIGRSDHLAALPRKIQVDGILTNKENRGNEMADYDQKDLERATTMPTRPHLTIAFYEDVLEMIGKYTMRERQQRRLRLAHFLGSCALSIGCFVAIWWSPTNYISFILILLSSLGLMAGTVDGLIGGLFIGSELRALCEFEWEIRKAIELAGGPTNKEEPLRDWFD
jgi:sphingomyelin phosphodiesterase 2